MVLVFQLKNVCFMVTTVIGAIIVVRQFLMAEVEGGNPNEKNKNRHNYHYSLLRVACVLFSKQFFDYYDSNER